MSPLAGLRIDAHVHLWRIEPGEYGWIEPGSPLDRDFTLDDLRAELTEVEGVVLVQAAPSKAETLFLLDQAARSAGLVKGVVGWADLAAPDAPQRIMALALRVPFKTLLCWPSDAALLRSGAHGPQGRSAPVLENRRQPTQPSGF